MKRAFTALGLLVLLAAPAAAGGLGIHGTWWDADEASDEFGAGLLFDFNVVSKVDFEVRASWYSDYDLVLFEGTSDAQLVTFSAAPLDFGFSYNFVKNKFTPYLGIGGTFYYFDTDKDQYGRLDDEWGWYGLAGIDFPIGPNWKIYGEVMYRSVDARLKGDDLGFQPTVDEGFSFKGPAAQVGIAWAW